MKMQTFEFNSLENFNAAKHYVELNYPNIVVQPTSISDTYTLAVETVNSLMFDTRIKGIMESYGGVAIEST